MHRLLPERQRVLVAGAALRVADEVRAPRLAWRRRRCVSQVDGGDLPVEVTHLGRGLLVARQAPAQRDQPVGEIVARGRRRPGALEALPFVVELRALPALGGDEGRIGAGVRRGGPTIELFVQARRRGVELHPPQRRRIGSARVGERAGAAEDEVDPPDAGQLLGSGDEERGPHLLGTRLPAADLPPEDDEIGRRRARQPPRRRAIERDQRDHQLGARAAQPGHLAPGGWHRILRLPTDPPRQRRIRHAEDAHPHVADRLELRRSDGRRVGEVHRQPARRDLAMPCADVVVRQPGGERTERLQRLPQEFGAQIVGRLFLGAGALGERQPAAVDQQRRSRVLGRSHERGVAGDVPQRIAVAAARLQRPPDLPRVKEGQMPLPGARLGLTTHERWPRDGDRKQHSDAEPRGSHEAALWQSETHPGNSRLGPDRGSRGRSSALPSGARRGRVRKPFEGSRGSRGRSSALPSGVRRGRVGKPFEGSRGSRGRSSALPSGVRRGRVGKPFEGSRGSRGRSSALPSGARRGRAREPFEGSRIDVSQA